MTPEAFVVGLAASVRESAEATADYLTAPPVPRPPAHLGRFAAWFQRLPAADRAIAREVIRYAAEGSLFALLTHLDNLAAVAGEPGDLEVWHTAPGGCRVRLNAPEGDLLTDLFNADGEPLS